MTSEQDFRSHLLTNGHSLETTKTYVANLRVYERALKPLELEQATRPDVERYLAREFGRLARNTVAGRLAALRAFYDFLGKPEITAGLKVKREKLAPQRPFDDEAVESLLQATTSPRDRAMITVALDCGLRVSELVGIRRDDVDLHTGLVLIRGKGATDRWVVLSARARSALIPFLVGRGPIWVSRSGDPLTVGHAKRTLSRIALRADVPAHWHRFRTTFASRFLDQTHDIDSLRVLMGHRDTTTTARYGEFASSARALEQMRHLSDMPNGAPSSDA